MYKNCKKIIWQRISLAGIQKIKNVVKMKKIKKQRLH
jgi:hypothetical protein